MNVKVRMRGEVLNYTFQIINFFSLCLGNNGYKIAIRKIFNVV